ncbi:SigB/SigF/SigG family RNA polymerase sigma factor [Streptomyces sp. NPDC001941]|uniref:SigB/SigF/SigG family RNA polymerase sigma factor n=1 Tax=Streptomyces sp. NPDC001941 TaxID=3154659 RepID=UPI00331D80E5
MNTAPSGTRPRPRPQRRPADPDTGALFQHLADLPEGAERDAVRDELARAWLPMAYRLADKYRDRGEQREDLRQVAAMGLVKAIDRYRDDVGAFEAYAIPTITGEIKRHFRDHAWSLHVPRSVQDLRNNVRRASRQLQAEGLKNPQPEQIAERTRLTVEQVRTGQAAMDAFRTLSLERAQGPEGDDDSLALGGLIGEEEAGFETVVERESVKRVLNELPEREKRILYLRFFADMTQARIAEEFGISQMHVSRLITRTCTRVRDQVLEGQRESRLPSRVPARRRPRGATRPVTHVTSQNAAA